MKKQSITLDIPPPPPPMEFEGFTQGTFDFLHGLKKNNNKEWFEKHRAEYEGELREPSKQLVGAMSAAFAEANIPLIADQRKSLFRINRDIRFSKDKSPYKTHIGIMFPLAGTKDDEWTGMYIGFEPEGKNDVKVYIGGGCHMPPGPYLKRIREKVATKYKELDKLNSDKNFRKEYPKGITGYGDSLKRAPKGYDPDHPAAEWLKMKSYTFGADLMKKDLMSKDLPKIIVKKVKAAQQALNFFKEK
jgi:uncharacterized protein (TIGR02453 family)